jgi:uncharacterized membrane protein
LPTPQNKQSSISGAEVVLLALLIFFGMALWVWVERGFDWFCRCEPKESRLLEQTGITQRQEELARLQEVTKQADAQLVGAQLDLQKQDAALKSLEALHPDVVKPTLASVSTETQKSYEATRNQQAADSQLIEYLSTYVALLKSQVKVNAAKLEADTETTARDFAKRNAIYTVEKSAVAFVLPLLLMLVVLVIVRWVFSHSLKISVWTNQGSLPYLIVAGALAILLAYQALQVAGAIVIATVLFLVVLWKIKWSAKIGKPPLAPNQE